MDSLQKMVEFTENCKFGMLDIIFPKFGRKRGREGRIFPINGIKICPSERLYDTRSNYDYIIII